MGAGRYAGEMHRIPRRLSLLAILAMLGIGLLGASSSAQAQVRRCTGADGSTIFTDRQCTDVDATEALARERAVAGNRGGVRRGCARSVSDLVYEITAAIDSHDGNRLGASYYWAGLSTRGGYAVLMRLQAIADRPLLDVRPVIPESKYPDYDPSPVRTITDTAIIDTIPPGPPAPRRRAPTALRVEQTIGTSTTPVQTVFGLRKAMGCWWVTL